MRGSDSASRRAPLDLGWLPLTYILPAHQTPAELADFEDELRSLGARLTYDAAEARLFLGRVERKGRAAFELRSRGVVVAEAVPDGDAGAAREQPPRKKARVREETGGSWSWGADTVKVVKKGWVDESLAEGRVLPLGGYTVYTGRIQAASSVPTAGDASGSASQGKGLGDLVRTKRRRPALYPESTSDREDASNIPPPPEWLVRGTKYSCQRATPVDNPNAGFIALLKKLRSVRKLQSDEIGVRAYSSAIASVAAYPHYITHRAEVARLPGCDGKISGLWSEWTECGSVREVDEAEQDERLRVSAEFFGIYGVGATTARAFYDRGWRSLDDVVEHGWEELQHIQQIGLKYHDEFQLKIPRQESERVRDVIVSAFGQVVQRRGGDAQLCQHCIVGGYRRGKAESGDIDVMVSHPDEAQTLDLIVPLLDQLVAQGWVTHSLNITTSSSQRGQAALPFRGSRAHGGFDSLDKALVVWQDLPSPLPPQWEAMDDNDMAAYRKAHPETLEGKPHRRVDLIVAPWSRVGCAVLGWSAGTTFERDLRSYSRHARGWKFDSSGIRSLATGKLVDLETRADGTRCASIDEAERRVFEGLGLVYRPPEERCTG